MYLASRSASGAVRSRGSRTKTSRSSRSGYGKSINDGRCECCCVVGDPVSLTGSPAESSGGAGVGVFFDPPLVWAGADGFTTRVAGPYDRQAESPSSLAVYIWTACLNRVLYVFKEPSLY